MNAELRDLIAQSTADRQSFERIQALLPADDGELDGLIELALAENRINEFGFAVLAAVAANRPVDSRHLVRGAAVLQQAQWLAEVALRMQGDVGRYLLEALDAQPFEPYDTALILLTIAIWRREHGHGPPPAEFFAKTRELLRIRKHDSPALGFLLSIAIYTEDDGLLEMLRKDHFPGRREKNWQQARKDALVLVQRILELNRRPLTERLPEKQGRIAAIGAPIRRSVEAVGRNEPCRCGSGKKYKHCCLEKDRNRLRKSSDIAGVTTDEIQAAPERTMTPARIDIAHTYEIEAIDPIKLTSKQMQHYLPRLIEYRLFDRLAEAFEKAGYADNLETAWNDGLHHAAAAGRKDIARRLIEVRKAQGFAEDGLAAATYFLIIEDDAAKALDYIEHAVRTALASSDLESLSSLARAVSESRFPALGIALARSVAPLLSPADSARLMEHVLRARDRLTLPPYDEMSEVLDTLALRAAEDAEMSEAYRDLQEKFEAQRRQSRQHNEELERRQKKIARLEQTAQVQAAAAPGSAVQAGRDRSREERRVAHLQEQVRLSRQKEDQMRREMQQMALENEELKKASGDSDAAAEPDIDREDEFFLDEEKPGAQPVRILDFSRDFQQHLNNAPRQIAAKTMAVLGRLASGHAEAFVGAVRLKACPSVMRHRIAIDWRLLFRLLPDRVDAVDLIPRQDLERRIKTLTTQYG